MLKATWDWYYGSNDEEVLADCKFGEPYMKGTEGKALNLIIRPGTLDNGKRVNVFSLERQEGSNDSGLEICAKHLKLLRHPNILRFLSCIPVELEYHLVTEHAYPLSTLLQHVDAHETCSGLHDIALALHFMHEKAQITHNNVCVESIYVTDDGPWKLGGFDYACLFHEATENHLESIPNYSTPPEEQGSNKVALPIKNELGYCRDVYCFGLLLKEFCDKIQFSSTLAKRAMQGTVDDLTRGDYENRPKFKEILNMKIFKSGYISIIHFLQSITLRSKAEKETFFKSLLSKIDSNYILPEVTGRRIVPLLLTPIVLAEQDAVNYAIKTILTPKRENGTASSEKGALLPESVFARYVIPKIVELFKSRLIHVRLVLMENFSQYIHLFENSVLTDVILPEILLGLHDCNNQLVQASLHALADAVAIVGGDVIVGEEREKIFSPGIPKFDGGALNESQSLAYKESYKFPQRKKVEKKATTPAPRKPTLLELAMLKKANIDSSVPPDVAVKQQRLAHEIAGRSKATANGRINGPKTKPYSTGKKSMRSKIVEQVVTQPDVETWASENSENSDMDWPNMDEEVYQDEQRKSSDKAPTESINIPSPPRPQQLKLGLKGTTKSKSFARSAGNSPMSPQGLKEVKQNNGQVRLGEEFEISVRKMTTTKPPEPEPDFFAGMEPDIKSSSKLIAALNGANTPSLAPKANSINRHEESLIISNSSTISSAFNAPTEDEDGWDDGEGFNWE